MKCSTCSFPMSDFGASASHHCGALTRVEAQAALSNLVTELRRLTAQRHDGTAVAARALLADLRDPARHTAQGYQQLYCRILASRRAHGGSAPAEWGSVHRASCRVFSSLLWVWRAEARKCSGEARAREWPPLRALEAAASR